jgi:hypothetical protein
MPASRTPLKEGLRPAEYKLESFISLVPTGSTRLHVRTVWLGACLTPRR